ncbi:MAG: sigma 54-interacting transcriptional regulator [Polyangiaceae bacterium]|nr:sigma 54-interacting transcriptional regulator [Polyangiaceae bacterium]
MHARRWRHSLAAHSSTTPALVEHTSVPELELIVEVEAGKAAPRRMTINGELLRIGSHSSNDLVLADPMVSRFHCQLTRGEEAWRIIDNGSLNGTRVGNIRVRDADLVMPECRITLGGSTILLREVGQKPAAPIPGAMSFGALKGGSQAMRKMYHTLQRVARTDSTVLIEGESGTGKELITAEIVRRSPRAEKPFIVVDCSAISPTVIESELFGHAKGAFTGAEKQRAGVFEAADGGSVFLDEIGELPLEMQPKLLRVLETGELRRVGENQLRKVDVRVIAATNRRLEREVNQGRFREDLFFRLSVVMVRVPPLRERTEDIPDLIDAVLQSLDATDKRHLFTQDVIEAMMKHDWPGNVRELKNFVERRVVFEAVGLGLEGDDVTPGAKVAEKAAKTPPSVDIEKPFRAAKEEMIDAFERVYLGALLAWANGNVSAASRKAKIDRMHLHRLLQQHGLRKSGSLID